MNENESFSSQIESLTPTFIIETAHKISINGQILKSKNYGVYGGCVTIAIVIKMKDVTKKSTYDSCGKTISVLSEIHHWPAARATNFAREYNIVHFPLLSHNILFPSIILEGMFIFFFTMQYSKNNNFKTAVKYLYDQTTTA